MKIKRRLFFDYIFAILALLFIVFLLSNNNFVEATGSALRALYIIDKDDPNTAVDVLVNDEDSVNELAVSYKAHVCAGNSTDTTLGISGTFNGTWQDTMDYGTVVVGLSTDQASATDGLEVLWSADGVTEHDSDVFSINANTGKVFSFGPARRYVKLKYTNGVTPQTLFNLQTILRRTYFKPSSHRIQDSIVDEDDAELTKSVLSGEDQDGTFQNIKSTEVGNLRVADFLTEVARGNIPGYSLERKFGSVATIQAATPADVWAYGITSGAETYTFSSTADIDRLSSSASGDNGLDVTIIGLDTNYAEVTQTIALDAADAQTPVALSTSLIRVNRAYNANGTDFAGNIYVFVNVATTGGVPNTVTNVRAYIPQGEGQTLQSIYTVPAGKTAYFMGLEASLTKAASATPVGGNFKGKTRLFGKVFRTQDDFDLISSGSSNKTYNLPIPLPFPEKTDFVPTVDVTANGAGASWAFTLLLIDN